MIDTKRDISCAFLSVLENDSGYDDAYMPMSSIAFALSVSPNRGHADTQVFSKFSAKPAARAFCGLLESQAKCKTQPDQKFKPALCNQTEPV